MRKELALTLVGGVFLAILGYCALAALVLGWIHSKRARLLVFRMLNRNIPAGKSAELVLDRDKAGPGGFFRFPGILIRYEVLLTTRDGREIRHLFDPDAIMRRNSRRKKSPFSFPVPERGAYYGSFDRFFAGDVLGLFRFYLPLPQDKSPRILALPRAAAEPIPVYIRSGGESQRQNIHYLRTDNLIDHRPYVPGDDPRRINWKLYGHAPSSELFVREGEREPPPHSRLLILVDTLTDPELYSPVSGRRGVDMLCENALAIALEYRDRGMALSIGYTGGGIVEGTDAELAEALAYPAAQPAPPDFPASPDDRGVLILALPRTAAENALDRFLKNRKQPGTPVDLVFLYEGDGLAEAAQTSVRHYGQRGRIHARQIRAGTY
jgi:uncharacterized protein (DUF58 family)